MMPLHDLRGDLATVLLYEDVGATSFRLPVYESSAIQNPQKQYLLLQLFLVIRFVALLRP